MARTVLVTGASGLLGRQVRLAFEIDGWNAIGTALKRINPPEVISLDILEQKQIERVLDDVKPDVVIHCAANRFPDSCSSDPEAAKAINVDASGFLAKATIARGAVLIYISTDYVFPGRKGDAPYAVSSTPDPPNVYGQTKLDGEKAVLRAAQSAGAKNKAIVLRVPILYGKCDEPHESAVNVLMSQLWAAQKIENGQKIKVDDYALRYPTNTSDVGRVCREIADRYLKASDSAETLPDTLQFSSEDQMTKWQMVQTFADIMGLPLDGMEPSKPNEAELEGVQRPYDCHLDTSNLKDLNIDVSTVHFRTWWRMEVGAFR
ncbi:unnamed protein product [Periconia digitata]|uniref:RmlD-like substrate binding domain-containing protein n=1 Tax=Periconia digitata TaxID=1303443 RepID=A0A9W4XIE9_9PLEO|nr:unnamed protein product [Periconia digitata]